MEGWGRESGRGVGRGVGGLRVGWRGGCEGGFFRPCGDDALDVRHNEGRELEELLHFGEGVGGT